MGAISEGAMNLISRELEHQFQSLGSTRHRKGQLLSPQLDALRTAPITDHGHLVHLTTPNRVTTNPRRRRICWVNARIDPSTAAICFDRISVCNKATHWFDAEKSVKDSDTHSSVAFCPPAAVPNAEEDQGASGLHFRAFRLLPGSGGFPGTGLQRS